MANVFPTLFHNPDGRGERNASEFGNDTPTPTTAPRRRPLRDENNNIILD